jgi:hypothetical protein
MKKYLLLASFSLIGMCQVAAAQMLIPTVTRIQDFFVQESNGIDAGVQPKLTALGSQASQKVLKMSLRVRIFPLNPGKVRPEISGVRGNCYLFISSTYPAHTSGNSLILMPTSYEWLDASPLEDLIRSGRYWVVLESGEESRSDFFLLDKNHMEDYFSSGMLLVIKPTAQPAKEQIMKAFKNRRRLTEAIELEVAAKIGNLTCYGFKKLTTESDDDYDETIATCLDIAPDSEG